MRWKTTSTTIVVKGSSAINKLLFTDISKFSSFNLEMSFNCSNSWESPATSTFTLVLYWSNTIKISPVPECWDFFEVKFLFNFLVIVSSRAELWITNNVVVLIEFSVCHITHTVDSKLVRKTLFVMFNDFVNLWSEYKFTINIWFREGLAWSIMMFSLELFVHSL